MPKGSMIATISSKSTRATSETGCCFSALGFDSATVGAFKGGSAPGPFATPETASKPTTRAETRGCAMASLQQNQGRLESDFSTQRPGGSRIHDATAAAINERPPANADPSATSPAKIFGEIT